MLRYKRCRLDPWVRKIPRSSKVGNGNSLQYSCLKNPMDRGAWWATVHGVIKSWTEWLRLFTLSPPCASYQDPQGKARRPGSYWRGPKASLPKQRAKLEKAMVELKEQWRPSVSLKNIFLIFKNMYFSIIPWSVLNTEWSQAHSILFFV